MDDKVKRIQVPNKYIDNKNFDNHSFYLYVILRMVCVNNHVNIYKNKLLEMLQWTHYQLKKYLDDLKNNKLITYEFNELPKFKPIELDIKPIKHNSKDIKNYFTQVDINTINKILESCNEIKVKPKQGEPKVIRDIKEKALRLFYLYEMYYNEEYKCAFIGYIKIKDAMDINNTYIKRINTKLDEKGIVSVDLGKWTEESTKENARKNPNKYVPHCNRAKKRTKQE